MRGFPSGYTGKQDPIPVDDDIARDLRKKGAVMERPAPEPESDALMDRVKRLEERMTRFEQDFRTMNVPDGETPNTGGTTPPGPDEDSRQDEEHGQPPAGL